MRKILILKMPVLSFLKTSNSTLLAGGLKLMKPTQMRSVLKELTLVMIGKLASCGILAPAKKTFRNYSLIKFTNEGFSSMKKIV